MPSLRRTISSPSVRSSPYPTLSNNLGSGASPRGTTHRRSSGSDLSNRRVLADIEWWRVADGQCEPDLDQESDGQNRDETYSADDFLGGAGLSGPELGVERPSTPLPFPLAEVCICSMLFNSLYDRGL